MEVRFTELLGNSWWAAWGKELMVELVLSLRAPALKGDDAKAQVALGCIAGAHSALRNDL